MILLSILIPSTPDREKMLNDLLIKLHYQKEAYDKYHAAHIGDIEILIDNSKRFLDGGLSIGKKRESLVQRASGKYVCFLDSDDNIPNNYIEALARLCFQNKDVCTFRAMCKLNEYWCLVDMSLNYEFNEQTTDRHDIRRKPWHICPVRAEYAKAEQFSDINHNEDYEWFSRVLKYCNFEAKSNQILYEYRHGDHSEADKILKQGYV